MDDLIYALADAIDIDRHLAADLLAQLQVEDEYQRYLAQEVN